MALSSRNRRAWLDRTDLTIELRVVGPELRVYIAIIDEIGPKAFDGFYEQLPCLRVARPVPYRDRNKYVVECNFNYAVDNQQSQPVRRRVGSETPAAAAERALRYCTIRCKRAFLQTDLRAIEQTDFDSNSNYRRFWWLRAVRVDDLFTEMRLAVADYSQEMAALAKQVRAAYTYYKRKS